MILILTKSINRCFEKNPKFDMTPLLGGIDVVFSSFIHSFSWNSATFLHAYTCLPLAYATRQAVGAILQDVADSGVLFAILMCRHKVISLVGAQKASLHPDDMLLLSNFVVSSESFRASALGLFCRRLDWIKRRSHLIAGSFRKRNMSGIKHVYGFPLKMNTSPGSSCYVQRRISETQLNLETVLT